MFNFTAHLIRVIIVTAFIFSDDFEGDEVMMTKAIVQHFREYHNDAPCDD